jgi:hypothetical protein
VNFTTLTLSPLAVLSGALKITDKLTLAMEAVGNKIRLNCQGWEDVRVIGESQVLMVVEYKGPLYILPEPGPAKFENIDQDGVHEAGYGPRTSNERLVYRQRAGDGRRIYAARRASVRRSGLQL